ncbi:bacterial Ig-like domain-containing protein [Candidatus Clostridium stratigraminis]|uniref:Bacterial Ig-like domain-containing protein n=1 Tax=Candidatus Clostridium stratigraminis TaxID=3381661 RepID=A0ABW8T8S7_9CLOT
MKKLKKSRFMAVMLSCLLLINTIITLPVHAATATNDTVNPPQLTTDKTDITTWNFGSLPSTTNGDIAATSGYYNNATTLLQLFQGTTPTKVQTGFSYSTSSLKNTGFQNPSYWLVTTSTKGFNNLVFNFTMYSAASGPRDFNTEWSTDGTNWQVFGNLNSSTQFTVKNPSAQLQNYGMKLPAAAENKDLIYIRVNKASETQTNGGTLTTSSSNIGNNINGIQLYGTKDPAFTTPAVTITPDTTNAILDVTQITLSCSDSNAQIYYTTDGTEPKTSVVGSTKLYTAPFTALSEGGFNGTSPFVVKAVAQSGTLLPSDTAISSFNQQAITSNADAKKLATGAYAWVKGIGTYLNGNATLYIQDGMKVGSGLCLYKSTTITDLSSYVGKEIYVYGKASPYNGLMEILPDTIIVRDANPVKPTPSKIMLSQLADRSYEGMLVSVDTVKLDNVAGITTTSNYSHTISQAGVQCILRANGIASSVGTTGSYVDLNSVIVNYNSGTPYNGAYLLSTNTANLAPAPTPTVEFMTASVASDTAVPLNSKVTLSTPTPGAKVTYSLNGGTSVTSTGNSVDVSIDAFQDGKATITATASDGTYTTAMQTFTYVQSQVAAVNASPENGAIAAGTQITLTSKTTGATIVYSLYANSYSDSDGTLVGTANQTYTAPITLDASAFPVRLVAKATLANYLDSNPVTLNYTAKKAVGGEKNYYGAIHGHTAENSDGQGTLAEADAYARDQGKFDFFILTDHSNSYDKAPTTDSVATIGNLNTYNTTNQQWLNGKNEAAKATTSTFLCDYAYEMTWSGGPGHINTFNTQGFVSRNNAALNNKTNDAGMKAYYDLLKNTPGSISQFNHPGPTFGNFSDFAYYDPMIDDKINLVEVGNGEGAVGSGGYFPSIDQYILALDKGWHVAPTNNGDNHKKGWGTSNTCATVVYTNDFTMAGIYQAMRDRSVWATENRDLDVTYHLSDGTNTYSMGAILDSAPATAQITVTAKNKNTATATSNIATIQLIGGGGRVIDKQTYAAGSSDVTYTYNMTAPKAGYYFVKITDNQGFNAVTAPIWLGSAAKVGITSVANNSVMPVTNEALKLTTTFFNNESTAATLKSISYTVNGDTSANQSYTLGTSIPALGTATHEFSYTPTTSGDKTVNISAVITVNGVDTTYTATSTMKVVDSDKVLYVGLDASHGNEYVSGGSYPNSMGNMMTLAAKNEVRVVQLNTSQELINACSNPKYKMIILNAPSRKTVAAWPTPTNYSPDEIAALKAFSENGNTLVIGDIADYAELNNADANTPKMNMAELQNQVLSAVGSTLREGDDEVIDDDTNGGQGYRLYPTEFNMSNPLMQGVVSGQTYSQYSGSTIYAVDPITGERTTTLPSSVSPLVFGFPTTYSAETDKDNFGYGSSKPTFPFVAFGANTQTDKGMNNAAGLYIPKYVNPNSKVATNPEEKLLAASETVVHSNGKTSLVVVAGGSFMSNFEIQVTMENSGTLPYSNYNIMDNLYKTVNPVEITNIADAKNLPDGTDVVIEGTATCDVNTQSVNTDTNKGFFDCIYAQDSTGGINLFPVASGIKEGQKARFYGKITHYQGEVELTVSKFNILDEGINKIAPADLSSKNSMLPSNTGLLVKTQGVVSNIFKDTDGTINQFTINDGTGPAIVFINGYITKGTALPFIKDGATVSVVGLASIGEVVSDSDMHARIRVRDRAEIVKVADAVEKTLSSITVTTQPTKVQYVVGQSLDLTGLVVTGTYNDGTTSPVTITSANISGFDSNTAGAKTVTVTVDGKTATFNVTVVAKALNSIAVTSQPTKTQYVVGQSLDLAGLVVTGTYNDGSKSPVTITSANISGFDSNTAGTKTVTVTVDGKTATFNVNVVASNDNTGGSTDTTKPIVNDKAKVVEVINSAAEKSTTIVDISNNTIADKEIFTAIAGKDKNVIFQKDGITWTFNGLNIKPELIKDIDLSLKTVSSDLKAKETAKAKDIVGKDVAIASFSFTYEGKLPGKADVKIFIGKEWANRTVNVLRYFADKNTYEVVGTKLATDADGYIVLTTDHCSDYIVIDNSAIDASKLPQTGSPIDFNMVVDLGALISALGVVMFLYGKRKKKFNE